MTCPQPTTPPRRRRWYQFSLRTLLIVMLLASVGLSWFAVKMQQARRQREAVAAIREAGGKVTYDYEFAYYDAGGDPFADLESPGPWWLRETLGVDFFAKPLYVSVGSNGRDVCLKKIAALPDLESLKLPEAEVTDEGLSHLPRLRQLKVLDLSYNEIRDDGLEYLRQFPQLEKLDLTGSWITDAGLEHLKRLSHLQWLDLFGTMVTAEGVAELQTALPDCEISWSKPNPGPAPAP